MLMAPADHSCPRNLFAMAFTSGKARWKHITAAIPPIGDATGSRRSILRPVKRRHDRQAGSPARQWQQNPKSGHLGRSVVDPLARAADDVRCQGWFDRHQRRRLGSLQSVAFAQARRMTAAPW